MDITIPYTPSPKQALFHSSPCEETFFGGSKGPGKSCALVMEGFAYACEYPGAKVYFFRESYDDLEANIIDEWLSKIPEKTKDNPNGLYTYNSSKHIAQMINGTKVFFRYVSNDKDADKYQGRSMDWIGIDELCKLSDYSIKVLLSCLRSPKGFPPRFRATANPGGIGHSYVKERYVTGTDYGKKITIDPETGNRIQFIAATVYDNPILMANDPAYVRRLENLPPDQKKAFLYGDWDIFSGQFYPEFKREKHVIPPFTPPPWWNKFRSIDYGLDMLACYWWAVDTHGKCYIYRELYESGLSLTKAALRILENSPEDEHISYTVASPDLWQRNKDKDTGETEAETMMAAGLNDLIPADNRRIPGWRRIRELLAPYDLDDEDNIIQLDPLLVITEDCPNAIRTLPAIQHDDKILEDVATEPHELTHAPESIRYGAMSRPQRSRSEKEIEDTKRRRRELLKPRNRITGT